MAWTTPQNITSMAGIFSYVAGIDSAMFNMILVVIWIVIFAGLRGSLSTTNSSAFTVASWATFIFTLFLTPSGVLYNGSTFILLGMCVAGMWAVYTSEAN